MNIPYLHNFVGIETSETETVASIGLSGPMSCQNLIAEGGAYLMFCTCVMEK